MANKILKTLTLPSADGQSITYELHPEWDNIENKNYEYIVQASFVNGGNLTSKTDITLIDFNWESLIQAIQENKRVICRMIDEDSLVYTDFLFTQYSKQPPRVTFVCSQPGYIEEFFIYSNGDISYGQRKIYTDSLLTEGGVPADAKATGDALNQKISIATTEGTGEAYTVTIPNIGPITEGFTFIMIPHTDSTSTRVTLSVNGSAATSLLKADVDGERWINGEYNSWLRANNAYLVTKGGAGGTMWLVMNMKVKAQDIIDSVAIEHGGTGASTVTDALSNLGAASNPNQLDNWYFTDPINQRGATSYTTTGFTIDRWKLESPSTGIELDANLTLNDGYITIAAGTTQTYFKQRLEKFDYTKTYTLSVMLGDGTISYTTGTNSVTLALSDGVSLSTTHYTPNFSVQLSIKANASIDIKAIKLEYGFVSTLANDEPPKKTEQLLECQRYYIRYATTSSGQWRMGCSHGSGMYVPLTLPVPMRIHPTLDYANVNIYPYVVGGAVAINNMTLAGNSANHQDFILNISHEKDALAPKQPGCLRFLANGYVALSADL